MKLASFASMRDVLVVSAAVLPLGLAGAQASPSGHGGDHGDHAASFGKPGEPAKVDRTIEVVARGLDYGIDKLRVRTGETIRFVVTNKSELPHDFTIGDAATQKAHREEMKKMMEQRGMASGGMKHDDTNAVFLQPGETKELVWTFTEPGTIEYACNVPGHYEAGMRGPIVVAASGAPSSPDGAGKASGHGGHGGAKSAHTH